MSDLEKPNPDKTDKSVCSVVALPPPDEVKQKVRYDRTLLDEVLKRDGVQLVGEYDNNKKILCQAGYEALLKRNEDTKQMWISIQNKSNMICRTCSEEKDLSQFQKRKYEKYYACVKECRICENKRKNTKTQERKLKGGFDREIREIYRSMKNNCKKRKVNINITEEYMLELYKKQNGICAYTGRKMTVETNHINKMSLDRIDSNKDYEEGNVAWCIWAANNMKQDLSIPECIKLMSEMITTMKKFCDKNKIEC